jgi:hypothetical protein
VEHGHLLFHLPHAWLKGARLISASGGAEGSEEFLEAQAALYRIVRRCAGRPEDKLKTPADGGNPGPYNGRSYGALSAQGRGQTGLETLPAHQKG